MQQSLSSPIIYFKEHLDSDSVPIKKRKKKNSDGVMFSGYIFVDLRCLI